MKESKKCFSQFAQKVTINIVFFLIMNFPQTSDFVISHYKTIDIIGAGSFSSVYKVENLLDHQIFAMKVFPKSNLMDRGDQERFQREVNAMAFIKHENLVKLYDFFSDDQNFYMIMDYCAGGELFDYIVDHSKLSEPEAAYVFRQIVEAIALCHSYGVAHRDLKPENVLITKFPHIKISDFGLCGFIDGHTLMKTFCGSPCYCSPECLSRVEYDGTKADVWSMGVILYSMVTGEHPWNIANTNLMVKQILNCQYDLPDWLSDDCQELIHGMLRLNASKRYTLKQISEHPWLKKAFQVETSSKLNPTLRIPSPQRLSLKEISENRSRRTTRSDSGIVSPFNSEDSICQQIVSDDEEVEEIGESDSEDKEKEKSDSPEEPKKAFGSILNFSSLPVLKRRQSSSSSYFMTVDHNSSIRRIKASRLSASKARQRSYGIFSLESKAPSKLLYGQKPKL